MPIPNGGDGDNGPAEQLSYSTIPDSKRPPIIQMPDKVFQGLPEKPRGAPLLLLGLLMPLTPCPSRTTSPPLAQKQAWRGNLGAGLPGHRANAEGGAGPFLPLLLRPAELGWTCSIWFGGGWAKAATRLLIVISRPSTLWRGWPPPVRPVPGDCKG